MSKTNADATRTNRFRFWLWLIAFIGVIVPRRLGADWRREKHLKSECKTCHGGQFAMKQESRRFER
ncbi:MAG: hypothetical protein J2P21_08890 [Chloracidobacterium sp.]|nr:hypothetical protein [Chloracidobacterium sp.]